MGIASYPGCLSYERPGYKARLCEDDVPIIIMVPSVHPLSSLLSCRFHQVVLSGGWNYTMETARVNS